MFASFLVVAVLALQESVISARAGADEAYLWGQGLPDGRQFEYVVSKAELAGVPEWFPEKQEPPLKIARAVELGKQAVKRDHPDFDDTKLWSIQLQQAPSQASKNRWYYVIQMYPVAGGDQSFDRQVTVLVMMDGSVVKPREKKRVHP